MPPSAIVNDPSAVLGDIPSLQDELNDMKEASFNSAPAHVQQVFVEHAKALASSDMLSQSLGVGDAAPDFALTDTDGKTVRSLELIQQGPIVVTFFRGNWCSFCATTLRALRRYAPHIRARGATLIAISPQTPEINKEIQDQAELHFTILSDPGSQLAQAFGIAFEMSEQMEGVYSSFGVEFAKNQGLEDFQGPHSLPLPATYVIEATNEDENLPLLTYAFVDTDHTNRAEPMDIIKALPKLSSESRKSLKYRLDLRYSQLQDQGIKDPAVGNMLFEMRQKRIAIEQSNLVNSALKKGDVLSDSSLLDSMKNACDETKAKLSKLFKRNPRHHHCSIRHGNRRRNSGSTKGSGDSKSSASSESSQKLFGSTGPVILAFVQDIDKPFDRIMMETMEQHYAQFRRHGVANVVIVVPKLNAEDSSKSITNGSTPMNIRILLDEDSRVAQQVFGIAYNGEPITATYVLDRDGRTVLFSHVFPDVTTRPEPSELVAVLDQHSSPFDVAGPGTRFGRGIFSLKLGGWKPFRGNRRESM